MPLKIGDKEYVMPGEAGTPRILGEETNIIEDEFGLDALRLINVLVDPDRAPKGYTISKALLALAWVCRSRSGEIVSLADVVKDTAPGDIDIIEEEDPKEEATQVIIETE